MAGESEASDREDLSTGIKDVADRSALDRDMWFVFDSAMVFMMVVQTWMLTGTADSSAFGNTSLLKMIRLVKITRMAHYRS